MGRGASKTSRDLAFARWIEHHGVVDIAAKLGVKRQAVYYWLTGHSNPTFDHMRKIKSITRGAIGYAEIIDRTLPKPPKSKTTKRVGA